MQVTAYLPVSHWFVAKIYNFLFICLTELSFAVNQFITRLTTIKWLLVNLRLYITNIFIFIEKCCHLKEVEKYFSNKHLLRGTIIVVKRLVHSYFMQICDIHFIVICLPYCMPFQLLTMSQPPDPLYILRGSGSPIASLKVVVFNVSMCIC